MSNVFALRGQYYRIRFTCQAKSLGSFGACCGKQREDPWIFWKLCYVWQLLRAPGKRARRTGECMRNQIGPYQRPAPPKRPLGLGASKTTQKPPVPMHEIEADAKIVLQGMIEKVRKPGRPSV